MQAMTMRSNIILLFLFLKVVNCEAKEPIKPWYKYFRGIELSGFSSDKFKAFDIGAEFRKDNVASFTMFRHSSDQLYLSNGIYGEFHWYFPITKIKLTPFLIITHCLNHVTSKTNELLPKGWLNYINGATASLGGGVFFEPNKSLQIGGSLNYEWQYVSEQKNSFNLRPLIHLKYEFKFI